MSDDDKVSPRDRRRAVRDQLRARKADEKQAAKSARAEGLRHYETDYIALKSAMLAKAALKGTANDWFAKGFRIVHMASQENHLVLLLEHVHCDCPPNLLPPAEA